jgi:hypothetical protein
MVKIFGQKYVIQIFPTYFGAGKKFSKTVITREQRPEGINSFQRFHTLSRLNLWPKDEVETA